MPRPKLFFTLLTAVLAGHAGWAQGTSPWRVYRMADGLAEPACVSVSIGSRGKVIAGHAVQPFAAELDGFSVTRIVAPARLPFRYYESPGGQLWTVATQGLLEYRGGAWALHAVAPIAASLRTNDATHLQFRLWPVRQGLVIFLLSEGLYEYNTESNEGEKVRLLLRASQTPLKAFSGMCSAKAGGVWVSGTHGILRLMPPGRGANTEPTWQSAAPVEDAGLINCHQPCEDAAGTVTVLAEETGTGRKLIAHFDGQKWQAQPMADNSIQMAWRAADKSCWAFSPTRLYKWYEGQAMAPYEDLLVRKINDMAVDTRGYFWLATSDGLFHYAPPIWRRPEPVGGIEAAITGLAAGPEDTIWYMAGSSWFWLRENREVAVPLPGATGRSAGGEAVFVPRTRSLAVESDGALYQIPVTAEGPGGALSRSQPGQYQALGAFRDEGLCVLSLASADVKTELKLFDGAVVRAWLQLPPDLGIGGLVRVYGARNGDIWLSGREGVAMLHDGKWEAFLSPDNTTPAAALAFAETPEGRVWCCTADRLWEYDGKTWTVLRESFDRIQSLVRSGSEKAWIGCYNGILRLAAGSWIENTVEDGLPSLDIRSLVEDQRGRIWAGTTHGLSVCSPESDPDPPRTSIEELTDREKTIPENGAVTITFGGNDKWKFTSRHRLLYSYRLDERDFSQFTDQSRFTFGDLAPGNHYFQVRAMDRNGNVDPKPAAVEFAVALPWYKEGRLLVIGLAGVALALFFALLAVNRHWRLLRSYAQVEQKVAERTRQLENANRELLQSQKMTALGTLAAGIAHDFNNILSIVKGSAQIIEDNLDNHAKVRTRLDRIKTVVDQGAGIVKAMLGFSRDSSQQTGLCDVNEVVQDTVTLLGDRFLREVQVSVEGAPDLPKVCASKDFIQQILLNFIFNAAEAITQRKEIVLKTGFLDSLPEQVALAPSPAGSYVRISVQDFGCGISPENLPRIFEPFFTTKAFSSRRGTGLGLLMVYRLADQMEAGLSVETALNRGSTFSLILPVRETPAPKDATSTTHPLDAYELRDDPHYRR